MITGAETAHLWLRPGMIFLEGRLPIVEAKVAAELGIRDDQVVQAVIQAQPEALKLNLKGSLVDLPKDLASAWRGLAGETLSFRAQLQADGSIALRPLQTAPGATSAATASASAPGAAAPAPAETTSEAVGESAVASRLTQLTLRQPNLNALLQLLTPATLNTLSAAIEQPDLRVALQNWMRLRPNMAMLTPERLQQMVLKGGWLTEALLAHGGGGDLIDLKATLRLLLKKGAFAGEKAALLSDSVDEIESRQLSALDTSGGRDGFVSLVLPFADAAPVALKFSRGRPLAQHEPPPLVIDLHTNSPDLGELWLQTRISQGSQVDLVMWARREDIALNAQRQAPGLADALQSAGLQMTRLQVIHGARESEPAEWVAPDTGSMVDIQT